MIHSNIFNTCFHIDSQNIKKSMDLLMKKKRAGLCDETFDENLMMS